MKTTVDIPDPLFTDLKRMAASRKMTIKAILEAALRHFLAAEKKGKGTFKLRDGRVDGQGLHPGIREGDWEQIRDMIYEGRGA